MLRHFAPVATIMLRAFIPRQKLFQSGVDHLQPLPGSFGGALAVDHINVVFINVNFHAPASFWPSVFGTEM